MLRRAPARAPLAIALAAATIFAAAAADAKVSLQGTLTTSAGWTDNILNAPDEAISGIPRESDFFFQLVPGAILASAAPRILQRLAYNLTADLFVTHSEANAYANTLEWAADISAARNVDIILTLQSQQGRLAQFNLNNSSAAATVGVVAPTNINFFSQNATEDLLARVLQHWNVRQLLLFRALIPIDRGQLPDTYDLNNEIGMERLIGGRDAVGLRLRGEYIKFVAPRDAMDVPLNGGDQQQVLTSLIANWRRDWSPSWSSEAALGVVDVVGMLTDPTTGQQTTINDVQPYALAALRLSRETATGELRYTHDVTPNPLAGTTFTIDEVAVQGALPFIKAKMFIGATVAYQYARALALDTTQQSGHGHVAIVDFTIGWQPRPEIGLFARYSLFDQFGQPATASALAVVPDLTRNIVLVGATVTYPAQAAARVARRQSSRVDRSDAGFPEEPHAGQTP